jgi:hypothetical protein
MQLALLRLRRKAKSNYTMNRTRDQQLSYLHGVSAPVIVSVRVNLLH